MEASAKLSFIRVTPRKLGLIADAIRGKNVNDALAYLRFSPRKKAAGLFYGLVKSVAANAVDQGRGTIDVDTLFIKELLVGCGPILKRFRPRAKGSAFRINKRSSHISIRVAEE